MKYMGSKKNMLKNGLGELFYSQINSSERFVDLFTGAGFVAWHIAESYPIPVLAVDLQKYSTILASSIISRDIEINSEKLIESWIRNSQICISKSRLYEKSVLIKNNNIIEWVHNSRKLCEYEQDDGVCWNSYGGYYLSPDQAVIFDVLLNRLPKFEPERTVCLAALISAASECVASPGHTAQPFRPTDTGSPFIQEAWSRDPLIYIEKSLIDICSRYAKIIGEAITDDANNVALTLTKNDLVFIDPPYSSVQYSRFYHVLEAIARGYKPRNIFGAGRYPPLSERPQSKFSNISQSKLGFESLLSILAKKECKIIITFPCEEASNGLSSVLIQEIGKKWFDIEDYSTIEGNLSTMGGNNTTRNARKKTKESILLLLPKKSKSKRIVT